MSRGILLAENSTPPSTEELDFYLSKTVESYRELWRRRNRLIALSMTLACAVLVIAFSQRNSESPEAVQVPIISVKLDPDTAASVLTFLAVFASTLSVYTRMSYKLYGAEIQQLHRLRFGTDAPLWSLTSISPTQLAQLFQSVGVMGHVYFFVIACFILAPFLGIMWHAQSVWTTLSLFNKIVYGSSLGILLVTALLDTFIEKKTESLLNNVRKANYE